MKTHVLTLAGLLLVSCAMAQTQKGNGILSGNVSVTYNRQSYPFNYLSDSGPNSVATTLSPVFTLTAGHFWRDNWLAGLSVSGTSTLNRQNLEANPNRTYPSNSVAVTATPFVRRYWQINSVYLFAGVGLSVGVSNDKQSFFDSSGQLVEAGQKSSSFGINPRLEAGVNYFLTNRLGLQLVASASSLPLNVAGLSAGLVYWTGPGRHADPQEERINPQTDPGRWVIEGGFSVTNQKNSQVVGSSAIESTVKTYSFSPSVGYFIKKNSLIGVSIPIVYNSNRATNTGVPTTDDAFWGVGISPYFQHYWTSTRLTPYTRVNTGYTRYNSGSLGGNAISGGLTIGLAYMAGKRFIVETSLANALVSYSSYDRLAGVGKLTLWSAGISAGLTGNFAVRYVL